MSAFSEIRTVSLNTQTLMMIIGRTLRQHERGRVRESGMNSKSGRVDRDDVSVSWRCRIYMFNKQIWSVAEARMCLFVVAPICTEIYNPQNTGNTLH